MAFTAADLLLAWLLDALLGDPRWIPWPHPVVLVGRAAERLEARLRVPGLPPSRLVARGACFWLLVVGGTAAAAGILLSAAQAVHPWLGRALCVYLAYSCLATRALDTEARGVAKALERGRLPEARRLVARIVGRDTDALSEAGVARAAVESVAESTSDGVVAPLFFLTAGAALGWGPLLALAYKAANTLDSTVGHRDERYEHFGKVSARADDAANWIPARATALLAAGAAQLLWRRGADALRVTRRDARKHASPNAGFPEAAFAGALGVRLGGASTYGGIPIEAPRLGEPGEEPSPSHIGASLGLLWAVSAAAASTGAATLALLS